MLKKFQKNAPFCRDSHEGYVFGVCSGFARYMGAPVLAVRLFFIVACGLTGVVAGGLAYLALSILLPDDSL